MSTSLSQFQDSFAQALFLMDPEHVAGIGALVHQPGFAVYRNTVMKGCIDALQANYPSVTRLVGEEWLRSAAAVYVRMYPPRDARMLYYGENLPAFLAQFTPAAALPYLPDVAQLDRFWTETHAAQDEAPLDPDALACLAPGALACTALYPHASARWGWFNDAPAYSIWKRNREAHGDDDEIDWHAEGALLVRPWGRVNSFALDAAACAFLDACMSGRALAEAATAALHVQQDADLAQLLATLLNAGAFGRMELLHGQP